MTATDIIAKKRDGKKLSTEEINYFVHNFVKNIIPDYQMSALLMAVHIRGMDFQETAALTRAMLNSGDKIDLSNISGPRLDKHSTGGVGDKVSLILAPLLAAAGINIPMISGRGLGHSGGTLDKLESIPGFRTDLSIDEFYKQIQSMQVSMIGQTAQIVPADKRMYALRGTTATVNSIPLITASILSKKLAEDIDGLVLDIKTGKGAFMTNIRDAIQLAKSLVGTAKLNGLPAKALITNMEQPLGYAAGNWLEILEVINALKGRGPRDLMIVTLALGIQMLLMAGKVTDYKIGLSKLQSILSEGHAFKKFLAMVEAQGGDVSYLLEPGKYSIAKNRMQIRCTESGYIKEVDALKIGVAVVKLGGGREIMSDSIEFGAGIKINKKIGDKAEKGDLLAVLYTERLNALKDAYELAKSAFIISKTPVPRPQLIFKLL